MCLDCGLMVSCATCIGYADCCPVMLQAIDGYQKALDMMDEALAIEAGDNEKIINMQEKIRRAK